MNRKIKTKLILIVIALIVSVAGTLVYFKINAVPKELLVVQDKSYDLGENIQTVEKEAKIFYVTNMPDTEYDKISAKIQEVKDTYLAESEVSKSFVQDWNANEIYDRYLNLEIIITIDGEEHITSYVFDKESKDELNLDSFFTDNALKNYEIANNGRLKLYEDKIVVGDKEIEPEKIPDVIKEDFGEYKPTPKPEPKPTPQPPKDIGRKLIAFTFDDGPSAKNTNAVMSIADQYNAKITFFALGSQIEKFPNIAKDIVNRNHQLASHSYDHPNLITLSLEQQQFQINKTEQLIRDVAGYQKTVMVRPPYGAYDQNLLNNIPKMYVNWSVDTLDWQSRDATAVCNSIVNDTKPGRIILMHDLYDSTTEGFRCGIEKLAAQGYEFVTVEQLFQAYGMDFVEGKMYNRGQ